MNQSVQDKLNKHFKDCDVKKYSKGEIITHAHNDPAGVFFLMSGMVEQYDITPAGNKLVINMFKPSAFFPMSWAINKTPNQYFFGAATNVELKIADADATVKLLQENPEMMFDLLSRVFKGTDAVLKRLTLAVGGIASNRLIFELLIEAYRFGTYITDSEVRIKLKQNDLATRSGLARETVSRELHKLEEENLITKAQGDILINVKLLENKLDIKI